MNYYQKSQSIEKKNEEPFFSVIIPTKNRSELVGYSIKSVLIQSFENFELIIIDNGDNNATKDVIDSFEDKRINYYKTGNLTMPDNWEFGCTKITGKYLIILGDRLVLKPNSLYKIFKIIQVYRPEVIKWQHDFFDESSGVGTPNVFSTFKAQFFNSDMIVKSFLDCDLDFFISHSPIGYDSCISQKIIKSIHHGPLKRLCVPNSPDYTMAFQILSVVDSVFCTPDNFATMEGSKYSRGMAVFRKENRNELLLTDFKTQEFNLYINVPIKVFTTYNSLINDYINISNAIGGRLKNFQLNKFNYFLYIYDELQRAKEEKVDVEAELNEWNDALLMEDDLLVKKIRNKINEIKNQQTQRNRLWKIQYLIQMVPKIGLYNVIKGVFKLIIWKLSTKRNFRDVIEYAATEY